MDVSSFTAVVLAGILAGSELTSCVRIVLDTAGFELMALAVVGE